MNGSIARSILAVVVSLLVVALCIGLAFGLCWLRLHHPLVLVIGLGLLATAIVTVFLRRKMGKL